METTTSTDRIEKTVTLTAPRARVWQAIADARQFGEWFRVRLDGEFAVGATIRGNITYPGYEYITMEVVVERMEPERFFSYRWHPYAIDPKVDYSPEPMTLVEFTLEDAPGGTRLTIVESGFDRVPLSRRAEAFRMNSDGWSEQMQNIERYVSRT
ncbi:MAG TPA: SRPBCC family protein [Vicinamibacterales bacterium]